MVHQEEYKGFTIEYDEPKWVVTQDESSTLAKSDTLSGAKARCDALIKRENEFQPFPAIATEREYQAFERWDTVTVVSVDQTNTKKVWVCGKNGTRRKVSIDSIIALTPQNLEAIKLIKDVSAQLEEQRKSTSRVIAETESRFAPVVLPIKHEIKEAE